jgi:hypothetical protein
MAIAGAGYALLALLEARIAPQLNIWVYGFFPHTWVQMIRGSGYRPVVFLGHGLIVGMFFALALGAAIAAVRLSTDTRRVVFTASVILIALGLVFSLSLAPLIFGLFLAGSVMLFRARRLVLFAGLLACLVIGYPALRSLDIFPTNAIVSAASVLSDARASSLAFRFDNEDQLIDRAMERPVFGWGMHARSRIHNERGVDVSVTDGHWIITVGRWGLAGFIGLYGLLLLPVLWLLRLGPATVPLPTAALALILAVKAVDLLPNGQLFALHWMFAGALLGYCENAARARRSDRVADRRQRGGGALAPAAARARSAVGAGSGDDAAIAEHTRPPRRRKGPIIGGSAGTRGAPSVPDPAEPPAGRSGRRPRSGLRRPGATDRQQGGS